MMILRHRSHLWLIVERIIEKCNIKIELKNHDKETNYSICNAYIVHSTRTDI